MKASILVPLLLASLPFATFAASTPLAPQTVIRIPGGEHGIGFDDIGYAAPLNRITVPAGATGNLVLIDPATDALTVILGVKVLASAPAGAGIDIISYSPRLHHLYVPGARAATLTIFDVSPSGALKALAVYKTAEHAHCVTDDNAGHVFVCDPHGGEILKIDDR